MADAPSSGTAPDTEAADTRPIGIFDSGVGGLTVVNELRKQLPTQTILFLGDTARLPYGTKSADTVTRYTQRNIDFLVGRGVGAVVVACNTASALALPRLVPSVPTWGVVEPGAARAAEVADRAVGILGTESTVLSEAYPRAIARHRPELEVVSQSCPLFVPLVEEGWLEDPVTREVAKRYLEPLLERQVDTIVLGCTHYPLLRPVLEEIAGPEVQLIDSAEVTALAVAAGLAEIDASAEITAEDHFYVTDSSERFARIAEQILGRTSANLEHIDL